MCYYYRICGREKNIPTILRTLWRNYVFRTLLRDAYSARHMHIKIHHFSFHLKIAQLSFNYVCIFKNVRIEQLIECIPSILRYRLSVTNNDKRVTVESPK